MTANTFRLADTFQFATDAIPTAIDLTQGVGAGAAHTFTKSVVIVTTASPIIDTNREIINIPAHGLNTGDKVLYQIEPTHTAVPPLIDNTEYFVISVDPNSIQLCNRIGDPAINITGPGVGNNHTLTRIIDTPIPVCTNYNFKLPDISFKLTDKCRLAVQSFDYVRNYPTFNCRSVGGIYIKNIQPFETYTTQGFSKGTLLLSAYFGNTLTYQNNDLENNSIPLPHNFNSILQNGLDIFVDSKKRNFNNADILGNINEDRFNLSLLIYELEDFDYGYQDMSDKQRNYKNIALS